MTRLPGPRALRGAAVLAVGLLLLATTQAWFVVHRAAAPGLPAIPLEHRPAPVAWAGALALVAALCLLGSLARPRVVLRALAMLTSGSALVGVVLAGRQVWAPGSGDAGVSVEPWYAVALASALAAVVLGVTAELVRTPDRPGRAVGAALDPVEAERRAQDAAWRSLSEGRDPTLGP